MSIYRRGPTPANTCPRCHETLVKAEATNGVAYCEKCGGVFADVPATQRIVSALDRRAGLGKMSSARCLAGSSGQSLP